MNVSGIIVKTLPQHVKEVMDNLSVLDSCEIHFHDDEGRIVVTIEGKSISEEMRRLKEIQVMPHVLSADLAYSYSEEELAEGLRHFERTKDDVPHMLKD